MEFTGERYVPELTSPQISYEHWHRYLYATRFVKGKTVLDVGSGEGYGSYLLALHAGKVTGLDTSREAVMHAGSKYTHPNLTFEIGAAGQLPPEWKDLIDVVVSFETMEHLDESDQLSFLSGVKEVLRADGLLILSTPNKLAYTDLAEHKNEFHLKELYPREFQDLLGTCFSTVRMLGQRVYPVSYMWPCDDGAAELAEFRLTMSDSGYRPSDESMLSRYTIAVCSDAEISWSGPSILVDLSDELIKEAAASIQREQQVEELTREKLSLAEQLRHMTERVLAVEEESRRTEERTQAAVKVEQQRAEELSQEVVTARQRGEELMQAAATAVERVEALEQELAARTAPEELQRTLDEQGAHLDELVTSVQVLSRQKDELRARLLDAHVQLAHRDEVILKLRNSIAELQGMLYRIHNGMLGRFYRVGRAVATLGRRR